MLVITTWGAIITFREQLIIISYLDDKNTDEIEAEG